VEEATGLVNSEVTEDDVTKRDESTELSKDEIHEIPDKRKENNRNESNIVREAYREKPCRLDATASSIK